MISYSVSITIFIGYLFYLLITNLHYLYYKVSDSTLSKF